jgi:hypothetical protein
MHGSVGEICKSILSEFSKTADNLRRVRAELLGDIDSTQAILVFTFLDLNYIDFLKFQSIAGTPKFTGREPNEVEFLNAKDNPDVNDAEFVFHYCTDTLVRIESQIGAIEQLPLRRKQQTS